MTVGELIDVLKGFDPSLVVKLSDWYQGWESVECTTATLVKPEVSTDRYTGAPIKIEPFVLLDLV